MKKTVGFFAIFGMIFLIVGFIVNRIGEKKDAEKKEKHHSYGIYEAYLKRVFDFSLAFLALIFLFPILVIIAILVKVKLGSPIIFSQERPGKDGRIFKLYKFRTMTEEKGADGKLLPDEERLTDFGKRLRVSSLDELPELFNILKGDMSIVGPRPLAIQYLPYYNKEEQHRHDVLPGLTGLAQVHGRNAVTWEERFYYDQQYVNKITFKGDVKIILQTVKTVWDHSGIGIRGIDSPPDFDVYRSNQLGGE